MTTCQDAPDHRGRRGLPFRPGDADDRGRAETEEQADLGKDGYVPVQRTKDRRGAWSHAVDHEHVVRVRESRVVAGWSEDELYRGIAQTCDPLPESLARQRVRDRDARARRYEEACKSGGRASLPKSDDRDALAAEILAGDLRIEAEAHAGLPTKPSCVPYMPSASRPRYDQRSAPPDRVQTPDISMRVTPAERSCAVFAVQRSMTIRSLTFRRQLSPILSFTMVARSMSMT